MIATILILLSLAQAGAIDPNEAEILFDQGRSAFLAGKDEDAILYLDRLRSIYPASPRTLPSLPLLGESYRKTGKASESITVFLEYAERVPNKTEKIYSLQKVGEIRQSIGKYTEALLTARDLLNSGKASPLPVSAETDARFLEIDALIALHRVKEAETALQALKRFAPTAEERIFGRQTSLTFAQCSKWASATSMKEEELIHEMRGRGACLQTILQTIAKEIILHPDWSDPPWQRIRESFQDYFRIAENPPVNPEIKTKEQELEYAKQTTLFLVRERESLRSSIRSWVEQNQEKPGWKEAGLAEKIKSVIAP